MKQIPRMTSKSDENRMWMREARLNQPFISGQRRILNGTSLPCFVSIDCPRVNRVAY